MVKVWYCTPFSIEKNLGAEYNAYMELIPEGDAACFIDGDVLFLTPDFGMIIHEYANKYPDAVLTCFANRIHELAKDQLLKHSNDVAQCIELAEMMKGEVPKVGIMNGPVSGFLLVVPKSIWNKHKFTEENRYRPGQPNLLGVDNEFTNKIRAAGIPILRMNGLYVYHTYRLLTGSKQHLL